MISPGQKLNTDFPLKIVRAGTETSVVFRELLTRRTIVSVHMLDRDGTVLAVIEKLDTRDFAAQLRSMLAGL